MRPWSWTRRTRPESLGREGEGLVRRARARGSRRSHDRHARQGVRGLRRLCRGSTGLDRLAGEHLPSVRLHDGAASGRRGRCTGGARARSGGERPAGFPAFQGADVPQPARGARPRHIRLDDPDRPGSRRRERASARVLRGARAQRGARRRHPAADRARRNGAHQALADRGTHGRPTRAGAGGGRGGGSESALGPGPLAQSPDPIRQYSAP